MAVKLDIKWVIVNTSTDITLKHNSDLKILRRCITHEVESQELEKIRKAFFSIGKMDFMRIDGKVHNGKFILIELTPDSHLGSQFSFTYAFNKNGKNYKQMIYEIINNALYYYQNPYSNVLKS